MSTGHGDPHAALRRVFGFPAFRGLQEPVVRHVIDGGDALVLMPTGGGKSICYQVPALCRAGTALVISPLIALMDDQVAALRQFGTKATAWHSEQDDEARRDGMKALADGSLKLLYLSPERLLAPGTIERLSAARVSLIAIDEAHCVSQWGHDFRPEYRELACLAERFPGVPRIALTATADGRTREDILRALAMPRAEVFAASFHRPNLHIAARPKIGETRQMLEALDAAGEGCAIVYCGTRARTERVAEWLLARDRYALAFHAGLPPERKRDAAARFRAGERVTIVATIAFGMGLDRPDVRSVVHLDMPGSPESYYQQIGRAGRDGEPARALLLYDGEDIARARRFAAASPAPETQKRVMQRRLEAMIGLTETAECRTRALLACFGEALPAECGHCDNCAAPPAMVDGTEAARMLLSAIYRTGQRFGAGYVTQVLRGEADERVRRFGHDRLPLFGIGRDRDAPRWRGVLRQLIARGVVDVEPEHGGLLLVEAEARPILRGETLVMLREVSVEPRARKSLRNGKRPFASATENQSAATDEALFERLRAWRREEARAQGVPAYLILADAVLREIARLRPRGAGTLALVKGIGERKMELYGPALVAEVSAADHAEETRRSRPAP